MSEQVLGLVALLIIGYVAFVLKGPVINKPAPPAAPIVKHSPAPLPPPPEPPRYIPPPKATAAPPPLSIPLSPELQAYTAAECAAADPPVPVEVAIAVMEHESGFQPDALHVNADGTRDHGLMQINDRALPWVAAKLGVTDIMEPKQNIRAGVGLLSYHIGNSGEIVKALMSYQYGAAGAQRKFEQGVTSSTFSRHIMERAAALGKEQP